MGKLVILLGACIVGIAIGFVTQIHCSQERDDIYKKCELPQNAREIHEENGKYFHTFRGNSEEKVEIKKWQYDAYMKAKPEFRKITRIALVGWVIAFISMVGLIFCAGKIY